ncbi:unnamed protein product, partial [Musa acuminata subsp. burmannicoides]
FSCQQITDARNCGIITLSNSKLLLAGAGMPRPLNGAGLIQNSCQVAAGESAQKIECVH